MKIKYKRNTVLANNKYNQNIFLSIQKIYQGSEKFVFTISLLIIQEFNPF